MKAYLQYLCRRYWLRDWWIVREAGHGSWESPIYEPYNAWKDTTHRYRGCVLDSHDEMAVRRLCDVLNQRARKSNFRDAH